MAQPPTSQPSEQVFSPTRHWQLSPLHSAGSGPRASAPPDVPELPGVPELPEASASPLPIV